MIFLLLLCFCFCFIYLDSYGLVLSHHTSPRAQTNTSSRFSPTKTQMPHSATNQSSPPLQPTKLSANREKKERKKSGASGDTPVNAGQKPLSYFSPSPVSIRTRQLLFVGKLWHCNTFSPRDPFYFFILTRGKSFFLNNPQQQECELDKCFVVWLGWWEGQRMKKIQFDMNLYKSVR